MKLLQLATHRINSYVSMGTSGLGVLLKGAKAFEEVLEKLHAFDPAAAAKHKGVQLFHMT